MENPQVEIERAMQILMRAASPDIQQAAIRKYFTNNAGFRHPMYSVMPAHNSREGIIAILQWYRVLSGRIELSVDNITYDAEKSIIFLDMTHVFHVRYSPFSPARTRLLTRLTLHKEGGRYYISYQEDFFHPDEFIGLIVPPLSKPVGLLLRFGGFACGLSARLAQAAFGIWSPRRDN
ncbi:hypothetical protein DFH94DRAFT_759205 [Russula ochroleuca]|jgi:hypothetical protein|uniref:SigF-like NTF2-like domain-containing protein n=1 Tax=Russula ochroleuca TaxID=152965 RepID=A0A9P5MS00_9AGAM|nr:hypothetical protein DFH94DRAFT_759205 [Russula ochroleuca]